MILTKEEYQDKIGHYKTVNNEAWRLRKQIIKHLLAYFWKYKKWRYVKFAIAVIVVGFFMQIFVLGHIETKIIELPGTKDTVYLEDTSKNMQAFLDKIGFMESGNNYKIKNQFGYLGRYQFGRAALSAIGMGGISEEDFLNTPELQEIAMLLLLKKQKDFFARYIGKYQGKTVGGIYITESGILAASNMAPQGVIDFLDSGGKNIFKDGNGTPITKYFKELSGYKLNF
jgi:hypothetical protein